MTRKLVLLGIAAITVISAAVAQSPYLPQQAYSTTGKGIAAMQHAATAGKYLFVFFWRERSQQTDAAWSTFQSAVGKVADRAESVAINVSEPAEKSMVDKFGVDRSPLPVVLALAPNGAITKGFLKFDESKVSQAFVTPGTAACLKALQSRKLVLLCVERRSPQVRQVSLQQVVAEFVSDARFAQATEVVAVDPGDPGEASLVRDFQVDPQSSTSVTILLAPPGSVVGKFLGPVTKDEIAAKLASAQSSCCPGGKCGPGGCCPGGKSGPGAR